MKKYYFIFLILFIAQTSWAKTSDSTALFFEAATNYKNADYDKAIESYESILQEGLESGPLYYNLGNAYFKRGDAGRAILNYERALQIMPHDSDLKFNYRYVAASIDDYRYEKPEGFVSKLIEGHRKFYTLNEMILILTCLFFGMLFFWIFTLYRRWKSGARWMVLGMLGWILIVFAFGFIFKIQYDKTAAVILDSADAKFEPRTEATTHFVMFEGQKVKILRQDNDWFKIERADGKKGWVYQDDIEKI